MPKEHSNGITKSTLKVRMHITKGSGATKEVVNNHNNSEELQEEIRAILKSINDRGELVMKNQRISVVPRAFYSHRFDSIIMLDIRGNEITSIEEAVCKNLSSVR